MGKIILFGAGKKFREIYSEVKNQINLNISYIIDNNVDIIGTNIDGIPVKHKNTIKNEENDSIVIISSDKYYNEMVDDIKKINQNIKFMSFKEYIENYFKYKGYCSLCGRNIPYWKTNGNNIHTKYKIIGNGLRTTRCPYCDSIDRNRWVYWVLKNKTNLFNNKYNVLHFAPEKQLYKVIKSSNLIDICTVDIIPGWTDLVEDITNLSFKDEMFDYIIVNHVLEHINDEKKALMELKRVLKKNGTIIMSFPITMDVKTFGEKNNESSTEAYRINMYGQADHVRLYGYDYMNRIEKYGFKVQSFSPKDYMSDDEIVYNGYSKDDIVIIVKNIL